MHNLYFLLCSNCEVSVLVVVVVGMVGGVVVVVVVDGDVGQQLSVRVSRHPAIVQLQL